MSSVEKLPSNKESCNIFLDNNFEKHSFISQMVLD
jgi:hypothetical protein